jgi:hypothetical protein
MNTDKDIKLMFLPLNGYLDQNDGWSVVILMKIDTFKAIACTKNRASLIKKQKKILNIGSDFLYFA